MVLQIPQKALPRDAPPALRDERRSAPPCGRKRLRLRAALASGPQPEEFPKFRIYPGFRVLTSTQRLAAWVCTRCLEPEVSPRSARGNPPSSIRAIPARLELCSPVVLACSFRCSNGLDESFGRDTNPVDRQGRRRPVYSRAPGALTPASRTVKITIMVMQPTRRIALSLGMALLARAAAAQDPAPIHVRTFNREYVNWNEVRSRTFAFPEASLSIRRRV
jgi:hypothetical protein